MIELIPSEWMKNYLKDKREFSDFEKAAMIWKSPTRQKWCIVQPKQMEEYLNQIIENE